jgi:hypothetical protein
MWMMMMTMMTTDQILKPFCTSQGLRGQVQAPARCQLFPAGIVLAAIQAAAVRVARLWQYLTIFLKSRASIFLTAFMARLLRGTLHRDTQHLGRQQRLPVSSQVWIHHCAGSGASLNSLRM